MNKKCKTFQASETLATLEFKHDMGTKDVIVQVYDSNQESVEVLIIREDNKVSLFFSEPPNMEMRVVVIG